MLTRQGQGLTDLTCKDKANHFQIQMVDYLYRQKRISQRYQLPIILVQYTKKDDTAIKEAKKPDLGCG